MANTEKKSIILPRNQSNLLSSNQRKFQINFEIKLSKARLEEFPKKCQAEFQIQLKKELLKVFSEAVIKRFPEKIKFLEELLKKHQ